jgi:hypothetical protein
VDIFTRQAELDTRPWDFLVWDNGVLDPNIAIKTGFHVDRPVAFNGTEAELLKRFAPDYQLPVEPEPVPEPVYVQFTRQDIEAIQSHLNAIVDVIMGRLFDIPK